MGIEGGLKLSVGWDGNTITTVGIASTRPFQATQLLQNITPQQAVEKVPLLYSLCGKSQAIAARLAAEAGQGMSGQMVRQSDEQLIILETIQEYLWRLLIDLPQVLDKAPFMQSLAHIRAPIQSAIKKLTDDGHWIRIGASESVSGETKPEIDWQGLSELLQQFVEQELLGCTLDKFTALSSPSDLSTWLIHSTSPTMSALAEFLIDDEVADPSLPLLPAVVNWTELHQLDQAITEDGLFVREPHWNGLPTETGAISRLQQHKLIQTLISEGRHRSARMVARLLDLLDCIVRLRVIDSADAASNRCGLSNLSSGVGISWVETARGLLVHRVKGCIDLVNEYAIVAPTEWNFHPDGALSQSLLGSKIENEQKLKQHVAKECLGLDPCVAYEIEVIHA